MNHCVVTAEVLDIFGELQKVTEDFMKALGFNSHEGWFKKFNSHVTLQDVNNLDKTTSNNSGVLVFPVKKINEKVNILYSKFSMIEKCRFPFFQ